MPLWKNKALVSPADGNCNRADAEAKGTVQREVTRRAGCGA